MRIIDLKIDNIRGIRDIYIAPNGENVVIVGPNGSGKSAVVDAIEFLLTGRISRLAGEGSKNLSLKEHGPHVDYRDKFESVNVKAKVKIDSSDQIIEIERKMTAPTKLKIIPKEAEHYLKPYLQIAEMGQNVLSRREILKYITAEAGKRAKEVQSLLNLEKVEALRGVFVAVQNNAEKEFKSSQSAFKTAQSNINSLLSIPSFSIQLVLDKINALRESLGGVQLDKVFTSDLKKGIIPPAGSETKERFSPDQIDNYIKQVRKIVKESNREIVSKAQRLITILEQISEDNNLKKNLMHKKLLDLGINLIDETGACPLCEKEWPAGELLKHLERRIENATIAQEKQKAISEMSLFIKEDFDLLINYVNNLIKAHEQLNISSNLKELVASYRESINDWSKAMISPEETYKSIKWPTTRISDILEEPLLEKAIIVPLEQAIHKVGQELSKEQNAWDTLTKMETLWDQYEKALANMLTNNLFKNRADAVLVHFESLDCTPMTGQIRLGESGGGGHYPPE